MRTTIPRRAIIGIAAVVACLEPTPRAMMRIYTNVPVADFPAALRNAPGHFLAEGYLNVRAAPYGAAGDGRTDDSAAFAAAVKDAYANNLVVYVPSGT